MMALTVWQPWASLIVAGAKVFEFRRYPAPRRFVGERIVIHAGKRPMDEDEVADLIDDLEPGRVPSSCFGGDPGPCEEVLAIAGEDPKALPLGCGLGTVKLGEPVRAIDRFAAEMDPATIDPAIWAWPMLAPERWASPVPARGAQGFWRWGAS